MTAEMPAAPISLFRIALALALLLKSTVEIRRGYFHYFDEGTYLFALHRKLNRRPRLQPWMNRLQFAARIPAAALLLLGIWPRPALAVLAVCLAIELRIYFKYHTNLMFLLALILLISPSRLDLFTLKRLHECDWNWREALRVDLGRSGDPFAQVLIALTLSVVYWATAYRKLNPAFLSGEVVRSHLAYVYDQRAFRRHADHWLPGLISQAVVSRNPAAMTLLRWSMVLTVAIEFALPFALLAPGSFRAAAIAGILLHGAFTVMYPGTLLHFSFLSVASFVCFAPPAAVRDALWRLSIQSGALMGRGLFR
jgi:hypothetical protein